MVLLESVPPSLPPSQDCSFPGGIAALRTGWVTSTHLRHIWFISYFCDGLGSQRKGTLVVMGGDILISLLGGDGGSFKHCSWNLPWERLLGDGRIIPRGYDRIIPCTRDVWLPCLAIRAVSVVEDQVRGVTWAAFGTYLEQISDCWTFCCHTSAWEAACLFCSWQVPNSSIKVSNPFLR